MNRRDFIRFAAGGLAAVAVMPTSLISSNERRMKITRQAARYRIHGNKRLGCSGFDFPDDPDILETGLFMPSM